MKTLIATAAGLALAFSVTAKPIDTATDYKTFMTEDFSTKQEALDAGFGLYDTLNSASNRELRHKLPTFAENVVGGISVESAQVKIEEIAVSRDSTMYRAVVDVGYSYRYKESGND